SLERERSNEFRARLDKVNAMSPAELRENYRFILSNKQFGSYRRREGGAGIGMLDIARRSGRKIWYNFQPLDGGRLFFHMQVFVPSPL
ncbi:MAG: DUF6272 family protein, partial [Catalinimonas sp.]